MRRELELLARNWKTWLTRASIVLVAVLAWLAPMALGMPGLDNGKAALFVISSAAHFLAAFTSVLTTADCISREKREGTLELLLLTKLHPLDVISQKAIAATAPVFSGLGALLPFFMAPVLIGGVSGEEVVAAMLLVCGSALLSAAVGMLVSVFCRSMIQSMAVTFLALVLFFGMGFLVKVPPGSFISELAGLVAPVACHLNLFEIPTVPNAAREAIFGSFCTIGLALCCFALSVVCLRVEMRRKELPWKKSDVPWQFGLVTIGATAVASHFTTRPEVLLGLALFCSGLTKLVLVAISAQVLNMKPWLEVVLTTPLHLREYVENATKRMLPPLGAIVGPCVLAQIVILKPLDGAYADIGTGVFLVCLADIYTLYYVGLWNGLKHRTVNAAVSSSLTSVVLLPIAIAAVCLAFGFRTQTFAGGLMLWVILCLLVDALNYTSARWLLNHRFRSAAAASA